MGLHYNLGLSRTQLSPDGPDGPGQPCNNGGVIIAGASPRRSSLESEAVQLAGVVPHGWAPAFLSGRSPVTPATPTPSLQPHQPLTVPGSHS